MKMDITSADRELILHSLAVAHSFYMQVDKHTGTGELTEHINDIAELMLSMSPNFAAFQSAAADADQIVEPIFMPFTDMRKEIDLDAIPF